MNNGNNQEGIGIYFTDKLETTDTYGLNVISAIINQDRFLNSRDTVDIIGVQQITKLLKALWPSDEEAMFYWISDYIPLSVPEEVEEHHLEEFAGKVGSSEIRNFQIELASNFGVENMVKAWNDILNIDGTYYPYIEGEIWYAIINPEIQVTVIK